LPAHGSLGHARRKVGGSFAALQRSGRLKVAAACSAASSDVVGARKDMRDMRLRQARKQPGPAVLRPPGSRHRRAARQGAAPARSGSGPRGIGPCASKRAAERTRAAIGPRASHRRTARFRPADSVVEQQRGDALAAALDRRRFGSRKSPPPDAARSPSGSSHRRRRAGDSHSRCARRTRCPSSGRNRRPLMRGGRGQREIVEPDAEPVACAPSPSAGRNRRRRCRCR
jgi:hypothetical protein